MTYSLSDVAGPIMFFLSIGWVVYWLVRFQALRREGATYKSWVWTVIAIALFGAAIGAFLVTQMLVRLGGSDWIELVVPLILIGWATLHWLNRLFRRRSF